jgi:hypothetical protein
MGPQTLMRDLPDPNKAVWINWVTKGGQEELVRVIESAALVGRDAQARIVHALKAHSEQMDHVEKNTEANSLWGLF